MNIKELRNKQAALLALVKAENRVFTKEEQADFDNLQSQIVAAVALVDAQNKIDATDKLLTIPATQNAQEPRIDVKKNEPKWKNAGELLQAVAKATIRNEVDPRLVKNAMGMNEGVSRWGIFS